MCSPREPSPRSRRRQETQTFQTKKDQSLVTSTATVQGFKGRALVLPARQEKLSRPRTKVAGCVATGLRSRATGSHNFGCGSQSPGDGLRSGGRGSRSFAGGLPSAGAGDRSAAPKHPNLTKTRPSASAPRQIFPICHAQLFIYDCDLRKSSCNHERTQGAHLATANMTDWSFVSRCSPQLHCYSLRSAVT